ncbi:MAG TPA: CapA family protein [Jatrophihabitans sp.]|jgi:poly-gamma-glutamate synthesis protein (capsule biosynthesis protein)
MRFTLSFAGDVHFMQRTATRLAADPATVFGEAAPGLAKADLTMVNLETAITTRGTPQDKEYHFRTDPRALTALRDAGIDVATEANNHAADYGDEGLTDTLAAIKASGFPVIGIGANADAAFAPYTTTINGQRIAIFAADRVDDETTLRLFSAGADKAGVANAHDPLLLQRVKQAADGGEFVVVYLHWGTEDVSCTNADQRSFADQLSAAGAKVIIGAHPHVLQGAGWRKDGTFVDYSMGDFLWWTADSAAEYDTGLLTLTVDHGKVVADNFAPAHVDDRGVPVPATGADAQRIDNLWNQARGCSDLSAQPTLP